MQEIKKFFKRFGTDVAGYICLLLVVPVGSLPGPGGIPLLIAGLGLLSVHNPWARKLLDYVKKHSSSLRDIFFPEKKLVQNLWDIGAISIFIAAFAVSTQVDIWYIRGLSTGLGAFASTIFLMNRKRLVRLQTALRKKR